MVVFFFFFQAEDGIRDLTVTGVQTCALPISHGSLSTLSGGLCSLPHRPGNFFGSAVAALRPQSEARGIHPQTRSVAWRARSLFCLTASYWRCGRQTLCALMQ